MNTVFWMENLKGKDQLEDLGVDGDNIRMDGIRVGRCGLGLFFSV
jgi:hypothetical protein